MISLTPELQASCRRRLRADASLGMGNVLWRALDVYPEDACLITCANPFDAAFGKITDHPTLGDWARLAEEYARRYAGLGVRRRTIVGIYGDHGSKYFLHFLALTRLGAVAAFVNDHMELAAAVRYMQGIGVSIVCTDDTRRHALLSIAWRDLRLVITDSDFRKVDAADFEPYVHDVKDPVLICHSSGTTGMPKPVLLQHGSFFFPVRKALERRRHPATRRGMCAMPPSHNSAISSAATAIANGEELILMARPDGPSVLKEIESHKPTSVGAFPMTLIDILASDPDRYDLSSVTMWANLGDAAHEKHIRSLMKYGGYRISGHASPGSLFVDGLGSSEMGFTLFSIVHSPFVRCFGRCLGRPYPWVEAAILDPGGGQVEVGKPGLLGVRSPSLFGGYWGNSTLTSLSNLNGYFLTGDIAHCDAQGRFFHLDRITDAVNTTRGPIHTLVYEEVVMNAAEKVLDCTVVALETHPGRAYLLCLAIVPDAWRGDISSLQHEANEALAARGLQPLDEMRRSHKDEIVVGVTGKVLKSQLRESLRRQLDLRDLGDREMSYGKSVGAPL